MKISLDITFFIQIVSFLLLWAALKRLAVDPILQILEQREARTRGGIAEAEKMRAAVDVAKGDYEAALRGARQAAAKEVDAARTATEAQHTAQLAAARAAAEADLARMRSDIRAQVDRARSTLADESRTIATLMAERVLGRNLTA